MGLHRRRRQWPLPERRRATVAPTARASRRWTTTTTRCRRPSLDKALANLNDLAMQARIVPAFKDGQAEGFKLFSIRPDSLYSKIGIVNGDVHQAHQRLRHEQPGEGPGDLHQAQGRQPDRSWSSTGTAASVRKTYNVR